MKYKIEIKKSVMKALKKAPREDQIKIARVIRKLADNPRPSNGLKLADSPYFRIRSAHYRIIYDIQDKSLIIIILKVGHRKDVYSDR